MDPEAPSALINIGSATELRGYSYDSVGSQTEVRAGGSATDRFVYDGEDQLRRAQKLASGSVTGTEEYYYDADGNRRGVVTRNAAGAVTGARVFIGGTELELTSTGALSQAFAYLSLGTPVAKIVSPAGGWTASSASNGDSMGDPNNRPSFNYLAKALSAIHESASNFRYGPAFIVNLLSLEDGQRNRPKLVSLFSDKAMEDDGPPDAHVLTRGSGPSRMDGMGRGRGALPDLPRLDATGKVHGELPDIAKPDQYDVEDLAAFRNELQKSVAKRIEKNIQHGRDLPHGERQAAEQALIQAIDKHLKD